MSKPVTQINGANGEPAMYAQLLNMVEQRGIKEGVINVNAAQKLTTRARAGSDLIIGPATLRIVE